MARLDRCAYCDYTEGEGSFYANLSPGDNGRVCLWDGQFLCEKCIAEEDVVVDEPESETEAPPTMSMWEE